MNLCVFTGRLTHDPESRSTTTGKTVVSFSIAVNEGKDKPATFVNCEAWEGTADFISNPQYFKKGSPISVQCRLKNERWDDKTDGTPRSRDKFVVDRAYFVPGSKQNSDNNTETDEVVEDEKPKSTTKKPGRPKAPVVEEGDDDIPF